MFLYHTIECLKKDSLRDNSRHLAGILFKNTVINATKDVEREQLWEKMNTEQQDLLKTGCLEALVSPSLNVVRAAGSCIAAICTFEIPKGRWLNVLEALCSNSEHESKEIRRASIVALGYICEELMTSEMQKEQSDYVISAFIDSLSKNKDDKEIMKISIQGIYHSLKFTVDHFRNNQGKTIIDTIIATCKYPSVQVREISMQ